MRIVERGVETRPSMSGGPEGHLLVGIAGIGNKVVVSADDCVDVDEVFGESRLAGAGVSHGPHSADKRRYRATASGRGDGSMFTHRSLDEGAIASPSASSDKEWFCQDGLHELVKLQPSWRR
jgi:hypothetical protein